MTEFDAIGFGALNIDKLFKVNKIAGKEEESFVIDYKQFCGGSAANTIVGLARLGLKTGFVGKVAQDLEGRILIDSFKKEKVDTKGIIEAERGRSGVVMGFVDRGGDRALYVSPGVNDIVDLKEIDTDYVKSVKLLHLTSFVGERSFESQRRLVEKLPEDVKVSFDPGMLYAKRGLSRLGSIIKRAFVVLPNQVELELLTGRDLEEGAKTLMGEGVQVVGVKLGERGCFITNGEESHMVKPYKVKVVDTTGAGDAWNAGFLYALLKKKSLMECGMLGNFVASRGIMKMGARTGLPRLAAYRQFKHGEK